MNHVSIAGQWVKESQCCDILILVWLLLLLQSFLNARTIFHPTLSSPFIFILTFPFLLHGKHDPLSPRLCKSLSFSIPFRLCPSTFRFRFGPIVFRERDAAFPIKGLAVSVHGRKQRACGVELYGQAVPVVDLGEWCAGLEEMCEGAAGKGWGV